MILSNKFKNKSCGTANANNNWSSNYEICSSISSYYKRISFTLPNTITDVVSAKEWLADNPVDYYYPLNTTIYESTILPNIQTNIGSSIIEIDTSIQPSNVEFTIIEKIIKI